MIHLDGIPRHATPWHIMSHHVMACHIMSWLVTSCCSMSHYIASCIGTPMIYLNGISHHATPWHIMSHHVMACHIMSWHVTLHHIMQCHVILCHLQRKCTDRKCQETIDTVWVYAIEDGYGVQSEPSSIIITSIEDPILTKSKGYTIQDVHDRYWPHQSSIIKGMW